LTDQGAAARRPAIFRKDRAMTPNNEPRLQTGYDYLAASLTSGPDAHQYRALLRAYLDHYDMGTTGDDTTADRIERLSAFLRILAAAAVAERAAT
jgi:hypothetical protein